MNYGCQSMVLPIKRLLVKHVRDAFRSQKHTEASWRSLYFTGCPDYEKSLAEYEKFLALFDGLGIEMNFAPADDTVTLDSLYMHDSVVITKKGAILCSMGKDARRTESAATAKVLQSLGIPILGAITGDGRLESGDIVWFEGGITAAGLGYRTNAEGIRQLQALVGDGVREWMVVQLPHADGIENILHLMSLVSLVDRDLAVVYPRFMPVFLLQWLKAHGFTLIEVPDDEYERLGSNVLAVAPRKCIMLDGLPRTRAALERNGAQVSVYKGDEISFKGTGGPTCLTRPLLRQ